MGVLILFHYAGRWESEGTSAFLKSEERSLTTAWLTRMNVIKPASVSFTEWTFKDLPERRVLMVHPPARLEWTLTEADRAVLLGFGFDPAVYGKPTNGADFILELVSQKFTHPVFRRRLDPVREAGDRGEKLQLVQLPPFEAGSRLVFRTEGGQFNDTAWDWIYLSQLKLRQGFSLQQKQYPRFNRYPQRVSGENFSIFEGQSGPFLFAPASSVMEFRLRGDERQVELDYGFLPNAYSEGGHTDGAIFRVELQSPDGGLRNLFEHYPKPSEQPGDRGLLTARILLPVHAAGDRLILSILPGEHGDASWDHTFLKRVEFK
ncbi:MAG: hypothetical protein JWM32_3019 [Verrucomicrobia bacterium]|nr:hypothetical protein [Verrucomicrobiota bacterium]